MMLDDVVHWVTSPMTVGVAVAGVVAGVLGWLLGWAAAMGRAAREARADGRRAEAYASRPAVSTEPSQPTPPPEPATAVAEMVTQERAVLDPPSPVAPPSDDRLEFYREELRRVTQELGLLEARALAAWDRTVPYLEECIADLTVENHDLRQTKRDTEERLAAEVRSVEQLRNIIGERDQRLAEIRKMP